MEKERSDESASSVRIMTMPGVEVSLIESDPAATDHEEFDFQQAMTAIREAERQAALENIIIF